ncbi:hypothetical protein [Oceanospirillum sediminis]|uniref:Uncharacterized protein n=1 Tax=Oceanospirillum sediminis TaxID=2760088 RepID=A0A839ILQ3_9GAMM|nr:hypothetical protein [Oceanospirillum sediminis]MBB1485888.1 hypothetical protein [Oceanospirillum sediminis]
MSETITIRTPGPIDLTQYKVQVGDTTEFIEKINGTQVDVENWAQQLTWCASDLQNAVSQIGDRYADVVQRSNQVSEDLQSARDLMDVSLNPAIEDAVEYISSLFSDGNASAILNPELKLKASSDISKSEPVVLNSNGTVSPVGIDGGYIGALNKITSEDTLYRAAVYVERYSAFIVAYANYKCIKFVMVGVSGGDAYVLDEGVVFVGNSFVHMYEDRDGNIDVFFVVVHIVNQNSIQK